MKNKNKTKIAFAILAATVLFAFILSAVDRSLDRYPDENTKIRLYGESHGAKQYYDIERELWKECYEAGERALFVELPYYTAEYLNLWMKEDSDEIIDQIFVDIQGTQSGNEYYYEFWHKIKEECPETVFYGTDVGHQYNVTGARYLEFLEENGMKDSENYRLAEECIRQGMEYYADDTVHNGISPIRERYMTVNFVNAYARCGSGDIMGIYGSYHVNRRAPEVMTARLLAYYGNIISSVRLSSIGFGENKPYRFGFSVTGFIFLLMLFIPNIYWGAKAKPAGYDEASKNENKILLMFERAGEALVSTSLLIFPAINPYLRRLPEGIFFDWKILMLVAALVLMILYECYWIKYFRSERTLRDQYSSFAGFPLAGAVLPVLAALLLGLYSGNLIITASSIILGIGHIGIHYMHSGCTPGTGLEVH